MAVVPEKTAARAQCQCKAYIRHRLQHPHTPVKAILTAWLAGCTNSHIELTINRHLAHKDRAMRQASSQYPVVYQTQLTPLARALSPPADCVANPLVVPACKEVFLEHNACCACEQMALKFLAWKGMCLIIKATLADRGLTTREQYLFHICHDAGSSIHASRSHKRMTCKRQPSPREKYLPGGHAR